MPFARAAPFLLPKKQRRTVMNKKTNTAQQNSPSSTAGYPTLAVYKREPVKYRDVTKGIILSLITFGIYYWFWQYSLIKEIRKLQKLDKDGGKNLFLCMIVPFYAHYWWFSRGETVRRALSENGQNAACNGGVLLILSLLGFGILSAAIMQNDLNDTITNEDITYVFSKEVMENTLDISDVFSKEVMENTLDIYENAILIPDGVSFIGYGKFCNNEDLTEIVIPSSVTLIEECAFLSCVNLTSIKYLGTMKSWIAIEKCESWDDDTGEYTVTCEDGTLDKQGNQI